MILVVLLSVFLSALSLFMSLAFGCFFFWVGWGRLEDSLDVSGRSWCLVSICCISLCFLHPLGHQRYSQTLRKAFFERFKAHLHDPPCLASEKKKKKNS